MNNELDPGGGAGGGSSFDDSSDADSSSSRNRRDGGGPILDPGRGSSSTSSTTDSTGSSSSEQLTSGTGGESSSESSDDSSDDSSSSSTFTDGRSRSGAELDSGGETGGGSNFVHDETREGAGDGTADQLTSGVDRSGRSSGPRPDRVETGAEDVEELTRGAASRGSSFRVERVDTGSQRVDEVTRGRDSTDVLRLPERDADLGDAVEVSPLASAIGGAASTAAGTRVGGAIGSGADALFGTRSEGDGFAGDLAGGFDTAAQGFDDLFVEPSRQSEPVLSGPIAPGVGGVQSTVDSEFVSGSSAIAAGALNLPAFGRDILEASSSAADVGTFVVDEGGEGAQLVGETAAGAAREVPSLLRAGGEAVREDPQRAAQVGVGIGVSAAAGGLAFRGARAGTSGVRRLADDVDDLATDTRGQAQIGRQRDRGDSSGTTRITGDDISSRRSGPDQGPSAFPDPGGRFQGGGGFSRGSPDRGTPDSNPAAVEPSGSGDGLGFRSVAREIETAQQPPRVDSPGSDLRTVTDFEDVTAGVRGVDADFAAGGALGGGIGLGQLADVNDVSGIAPLGQTRSGQQRGTLTATDSVALGGVGLTLGSVEEVTAGVGTATGTVTGTGTDTDVGTGTDTLAGAANRAGAGIGSGTGTGSDTSQTPRTGTPPASRPAPPGTRVTPQNRPLRPPARPTTRTPPRPPSLPDLDLGGDDSRRRRDRGEDEFAFAFEPDTDILTGDPIDDSALDDELGF